MAANEVYFWGGYYNLGFFHALAKWKRLNYPTEISGYTKSFGLLSKLQKKENCVLLLSLKKIKRRNTEDLPGLWQYIFRLLFHRITASLNWGWRECLGIMLYTPPAQASSTRASWQVPCLVGFWISSQNETLQPL